MNTIYDSSMGINSTLDKERKRDLAVAQGDTYALALDEMKEEDVSASIQVDDYIISLACEDAEGMYMYNSKDTLAWMIPEKSDNQHFEVVVQDKDDKRFIPGLEIHAQLLGENKKIVAEMVVPFIWHPFLFHYGTNCKIPKAGKYYAKIHIKKPPFHRHDEVYGKRYKKDVSVTLGPIKLKPGRKIHGEE